MYGGRAGASPHPELMIVWRRLLMLAAVRVRVI